MDQSDYDQGLDNLLLNEQDYDTIPVLDGWPAFDTSQNSTPVQTVIAAENPTAMEYDSGFHGEFSGFSDTGFQNTSTRPQDQLNDPAPLPQEGQCEFTSPKMTQDQFDDQALLPQQGQYQSIPSGWGPDQLNDQTLLPQQGQYKPSSASNTIKTLDRFNGQNLLAPQGQFDYTYPPSAQAPNPQFYNQPRGVYPDPPQIPTFDLWTPPPAGSLDQPAPAPVEKASQFPLLTGNALRPAIGSTMKKYTECEGDVRADQGPNIEYVSNKGDIVKSSEVLWNAVRGWFIPLHQRTKDEFKKRGGTRPGTNNPLYEVCKWSRGDKTGESECLGINVYGPEFSRPEDWELPNGKGRISYDKDGCFPNGATLTAEQIRLYIDNNPRFSKFRIFVANTPSQATHRLFENKQCIWSGCPCPNRTLRQGYHQVIFDEYTDQTDAGERDPFRVAGRMHLWCFEQCCDIVEDFKRGLVKPETRQLRREQKNAMALDRDCNKTVERETYDPWFRYHIEKMGTNQRLEAHPFEESLAYVLTGHHLKNQAQRRQKVRDARNQHKVDPCSLDITEGSVLKLHQQKQDVSNGWLDVAWQHGKRFQASNVRNPNYHLPDYVGTRASGLGVVLDESLLTTNATKNSKGKKRSRTEFETADKNGGTGAVQHREESSERPRKSPRRSAASTSPAQEQDTQHVHSAAPSSSPKKHSYTEFEIIDDSGGNGATEPRNESSGRPRKPPRRSALPTTPAQEQATQAESNPSGFALPTTLIEEQPTQVVVDPALFSSPSQEQPMQAEKNNIRGLGLTLPTKPTPEQPKQAEKKNTSGLVFPPMPIQEQPTQIVIDPALFTSPAQEQPTQDEINQILLLESAPHHTEPAAVDHAPSESPAPASTPIQEQTFQADNGSNEHISSTSPNQEQVSPPASDGSLFGGDSPVEREAAQPQSRSLALPAAAPEADG